MKPYALTCVNETSKKMVGIKPVLSRQRSDLDLRVSTAPFDPNAQVGKRFHSVTHSNAAAGDTWSRAAGSHSEQRSDSEEQHSDDAFHLVAAVQRGQQHHGARRRPVKGLVFGFQSAGTKESGRETVKH